MVNDPRVQPALASLISKSAGGNFMKDSRALAFHYSAGSQGLDTGRSRSEHPAAEAAPGLATGQSLALALALSLGLWGAFWWAVSAVISSWP